MTRGYTNQVASGGGAATTNKVELRKSDGTIAYYSTITAAEAAAGANDTLNCYGIFNEASLGKNGVGYFFPPGSGITYTGGLGTSPIFDDGGVAMSFKVYGQGSFICSGTSGGTNTQGSIVTISNASSVLYFEAAYCESGYGHVIRNDGTFKGDIDYIYNRRAATACIYSGGGSLWANVDEMLSLGAGIYAFGSGTCVVDADVLTCDTTAINGGPGTVLVHIKKITTSSATAGAIVSGGGTLYVDVLGECLSAAHCVEQGYVGDTFIEGRFKTTHATTDVIRLLAHGVRIDGGSQLISTGTGTAAASYDYTGSYNVVLNGPVVSNKAFHATAVARVSALVTDATYVS